MKSRMLAFVLACSLPALVHAQIYSWKDSSGRTHFSDQPPPSGTARAVRSGSGAASGYMTDADQAPSAAAASAVPDAKASAPKSWQERDQDFAKRQAEKAEAEAKAQKEKTAQAEKDRYCNDLRRNIAMLERGGRISKANDKGEAIPMSDAQLQAEAERSRAALAKSCK